jgi:outer membrane protein assembly factor BamB
MRPTVLILCLVIFGAAGELLYWYKLQRRTPAPSVQIPEIKWTKFLPSAGFYTSPIVGHDGGLYIADTEEVYSLDPSNALRWQYRVDLHDSIAGGLFQDERQNIYFTTWTQMYSLGPSGLKRWQTSCSPGKIAGDDQGGTFDGSVVYSTCGQKFYARNRDDGKELWSMSNIDSETAPLMLNGGVLVFVRDRRMFAADRAGKTLWTYPDAAVSTLDPRETTIDTPIAVGPDGTFYAGSRIGKFVAVDANGGVKWTVDGGNQAGYRTSPVVTSDGMIIVVTVQGVATAFAADGTERWRFWLPRAINWSPHAAPILGSDGTIYVLAKQVLIALSAQGKFIWQLPLPGTLIGSPALASDGTLYVATAEGLIYAVQTESHGLMQSIWPGSQYASSNSGRALGVTDK